MQQDLFGLLRLYTFLHETSVPEDSAALQALWARILENPDYHLIVAEEDGQIVSSCTCLIVPNLTHVQRPYALIENVVTAAAYRGRGLAAGCLAFAKEIALRENCYKLMLMTGSQEESTLRFYERAGYDKTGKTGFVMWL
jgi:GNAT superfamily N-acetyltransferase